MVKPVINFLETAVSRKVPRFLYHLTCKKNYESILSDGILKMSRGEFSDGVFTIDLINFFKRWKGSGTWESIHGDSLQKALIGQIAKGTDEIVMLKIPTSNLDTGKLAIRSQNDFFSWILKNEDALDEISRKINLYESSSQIEKESYAGKLLLEYLKSSVQNSKDIELMTGKIPAYLSKHFTQKKQALEYIYKDNIPIEFTEKIGEINVAELRRTAQYDPIRPVKSIFTSLLDGTPECKAAELLNC